MTDLHTPSDESPIEVEDAITLQDEDGKEHLFHVLTIIELGGKDYALLAPEMDDDDAGVGDDGDEEITLVRLEKNRTEVEMIEDDAEFNAVVAEIERLADEDEGESTPEP